jgi:uncharacterized protein Smg (DUF494 family)
MTEAEIKKLNDAGFTPEKINHTINMMFLLTDVQEQYLLEFTRMLKASGMYGFDLKYKIERAIKEARNLVKFVDKNCNYEFAERYGDRADMLKEVVDKWGEEN